MKNYPIIKVAILFIAGILSALFFHISIPVVILLFLVTILILYFKRKLRDNSHYSFFTLFVLGCLVFSIGNYLANQTTISFDPFLTKIDKVKNTTAVGEITKIDLIRNNELIFYLAVDSMYSDEFFIKDEINILCKAKLDNKATLELYNELKPGNYLEVKGYYYKGKQKRNPGEYDYDAYLKSKEILGLLSVTDITSITIINYEVSTFKNIIHQVRKAIDGEIKKYHSHETAALLRGLLLADRGEINYQTKTQFINAGVVHVLAVSGLHVGYIILIFIFLFGDLIYTSIYPNNYRPFILYADYRCAAISFQSHSYDYCYNYFFIVKQKHESHQLNFNSCLNNTCDQSK